MRPAQFMAHIQFQQKASDYHLLLRDEQGALERRVYPVSMEDDINNERLLKQAQRCGCAAMRLFAELNAAQKGVILQAGKGVQR